MWLLAHCFIWNCHFNKCHLYLCIATTFPEVTLLLPNTQMTNKDIDVCPLYLSHIIFCNILGQILCRFKSGQLLGCSIRFRKTLPLTVTKSLALAYYLIAAAEKGQPAHDIRFQCLCSLCFPNPSLKSSRLSFSYSSRRKTMTGSSY